MSTRDNGQDDNNMLARFFKPELVAYIIAQIVVITVAFTSLDARVRTLEQLRTEDQNRIERRLEDMQKSLNRIVDWQIEQAPRITTNG